MTTMTPETGHPLRFRRARHYALDLETPARTIDAAVVSVALTRAGDDSQRWSWVVRPKGQESRAVDLDTVLWWMRQPKEAQEAFATEEAQRGAKHIFVVLSEIFNILWVDDGDHCLWAKPQHFDIAILESLYREFAAAKGDQLLHRRKVHNARTLYESTSVVYGTEIDEIHLPGGAKHDASYDALLTAHTVERCLGILKHVRRVYAAAIGEPE